MDNSFVFNEGGANPFDAETLSTDGSCEDWDAAYNDHGELHDGELEAPEPEVEPMCEFDSPVAPSVATTTTIATAEEPASTSAAAAAQHGCGLEAPEPEVEPIDEAEPPAAPAVEAEEVLASPTIPEPQDADEGEHEQEQDGALRELDASEYAVAPQSDPEQDDAEEEDEEQDENAPPAAAGGDEAAVNDAPPPSHVRLTRAAINRAEDVRKQQMRCHQRQRQAAAIAAAAHNPNPKAARAPRPATAPVAPRCFEQRPTKVALTSEEIELQQIEQWRKTMKTKAKARNYAQGCGADGVPVVAQRHPTVPSSPQVLRRGSGKVVETSEQRQLREMAEAQAALKANLRQSRRNMQHATSHAISNVNNKPHSTRALTIPESPQFGTTHAKARGQSREPSNHRSVTREEVNAYARDFRKNNTSDAAREAQAFRSRNGPTVAVGPSFVTEARAEAHRGASKQPLSYEEQQMAIAAQYQFKARPINEAVFNGCGTIGVPTTAARSLTQPEPFNLHEGRTRPSKVSSEADEGEKWAFKARPMPSGNSTLGQTTYVAKRAPTVPESPNLSSSARAGRHGEPLTTEEMTVREIMTTQFRALPMPDQSCGGSMGSGGVAPRSCTIPVSPKLSAASRARDTDKLTTEELEAQEMMAFSFKARPCPDPSAGAGFSSTHVQPRAPTMPESPRISKNTGPRRVIESTEDLQVRETTKQFKARAPPGVSTIESRFLKSAAAAAVKSASAALSAAREREEMAMIGPNGHWGNGWAGELTEIEEFNMPGQQIHEAKKAAFERRLSEERAAEDELRATGFVARPMPDGRGDGGFQPSQGQGSSFQATLTEFEEFQLESLTRHQVRKEQLHRQLEQERHREEAAREFKAKSLPGTTYEPGFVPRESERAPLEPCSFNVYSDARAAQRAEYDLANRRRNEEVQVMRRRAEAIREEDQENEVQQLLNLPVEQGGMLFKAKAVPRYAQRGGQASFVPKSSKKGLTVPETPEVLKRPSYKKPHASMISSHKPTKLGGGARRVAVAR